MQSNTKSFSDHATPILLGLLSAICTGTFVFVLKDHDRITVVETKIEMFAEDKRKENRTAQNAEPFAILPITEDLKKKK